LGSSQLTSMGINPVLTDTSVPADSTAPSITGLSFSPSVADTSKSSQNVTLTISATDDFSGLDFSPTSPYLAQIQFELQSPSGNQTVYSSAFNPTPQVGGTPVAGVWQVSIFMPQYSEQGTWNLVYCNVRDKVGNTRTYTVQDLQALG